jgi:hypothetical protein
MLAGGGLSINRLAVVGDCVAWRRVRREMDAIPATQSVI